MRRAFSHCILLSSGLALTVVCALSCHKPVAESREPTPGRNWIGSLEIVEENIPPTDLTKVKPEDLARHIEAIYRLKPDRRFVYAISEIHRLLGGRQETAFVRHVANGGWKVRLGKADVGELPEIPTFTDGLTLARAWTARESQQRAKSIARPPDAAEESRLQQEIWHSSFEQLLRIVVRLNELSSKARGDPALLRVAGDALLALHVQTLDSTGVLDPMLGRAMALLIVSEEASGVAADGRSLSVLAGELGYHEEALDLASALAFDDPWRLYLLRNAARLAAVAASSKDPFVTELALGAAVGRRDRMAVFSIGEAAGIADPPTFQFLSALVLLEDFSLQPIAADRLALEVFRRATEARLPDTALGRPPLFARAKASWRKLLGRGLSGAVPARLGEFEAAVRSQAARLDGPLADETVFSGLLRAPLYAALLDQAYYYLDRYGSTPAAAEWAASIVEPPSGFAAELKRWVEDRVALRNARPDGMDRIARDFGTIRHLGPWALRRTCTSVWWGKKSVWDPAARHPIRGLFDGMDTRPYHLGTAAFVARQLLQDVKRRERYSIAALRGSPGAVDPDTLGFILKNLRDQRLLERLADRQDLGTGTRGTALEALLEVKGVAAEPVFERLQGLIDEVGNEASSPLLESLVGALDRKGRQAEADRAIDDWLACQGKDGGLDRAAILELKAARLRNAGHLADAWRTIGPAAETGKESCLIEAGNILMAQGRYAEALAVAEDTVKRYEGSYDGFALMAEALWRLSRPLDAAKRLSKGLQGRSPSAWSYNVGPAFSRAFASAQPAAVDPAVQELERAGAPRQAVRDLAIGVGRTGNHRLAFRILSSLTGPSDMERSAVFFAYSELRDADGGQAALDWFKTRVPPLDDPMVNWAYQKGQDDLIWDYVDQTPGNVNPDKLHLLRAAAWIRAPRPDAGRRAVIVAYAQKTRQGDWGAIYPMYLIGETGEGALLALAKGLDGICSAAWAVGTRKASEGKFAEANDWYQVAVETGRQDLPPFGYSYELLMKWAGEEQFLDALAAEKKLF